MENKKIILKTEELEMQLLSLERKLKKISDEFDKLKPLSGQSTQNAALDMAAGKTGD